MKLRKKVQRALEEHPEWLQLSRLGAAKEIINAGYCDATPNAVRKQIKRILDREDLRMPPKDTPAPVASGVRELQEDYFYNDVDDKYVIFAGPAKGVIDGGLVRAIRQKYSNMGMGDTVNELALEYGFTPEFIKGLLRATNTTHASLPLTDEEIAATIGDEDAEHAAFQNMVMMQAQKLHRRAQKELWRRTQEDARKWREFEQGRLKPLLELVEQHPPRRHVFQMAGHPDDFDVLFNASDVHIGALGIHGEGLEDTHRALMETTERLIERVAQRGRPRRVVAVLNGDWFHADTPRGTTTRGTPLDMACTPDEAFGVGCDIAIEYIDRLRSLGHTTVYVVRGNHDNMTSLALNRVLIEAYRRIDGVEVVEATCEPWHMMMLGKAHLYFEHGDGPKGAKITPVMAKVGKAMWGQCNHHYAFTGHLHHMKVLDEYGVVHIQMPSLARPDRYHAKGGWCTSTRMQEAYCFDAHGFLFDTIRAHG